MHRKSVQATGVVTRSPDGDEHEYLKVPISSTGIDRDGDEFSDDGLKDLRDQITAKSRPVFENHGRKEGGGGLFGGLRYDWKDIIGSLEDAEIEEGTEKSDDGESVDVLYGYIRPNPQNERGQQLTGYVKADMPVGFSIGFGVKNADEKDAGGLIFNSTDLMEVSSVGIQSNRESVATNAANTAVAMAKRAGDFDDLELDERTFAKAIVDEMLEHQDGTASDPAPPEQRVKQVLDTDTGTDGGDGGSDNTMTDKDNDELLERLISLEEDAVEERSEIKNRLDALEKESDDDDEDDDDEDEDDDEKSAIDGERLDKLEENISEMRSFLDELDPEESGTKSTVPDDETGESEDTTKEFEL